MFKDGVTVFGSLARKINLSLYVNKRLIKGHNDSPRLLTYSYYTDCRPV